VDKTVRSKKAKFVLFGTDYRGLSFGTSGKNWLRLFSFD